MKKPLKSFTFLLLMATLYCSQMPVSINASTPETTTTKEYLPDGSYIETEIIQNKNTKSTITGARKRSTYKNASGVDLWYGEVTANFYYDGSSSSCTSASASAGSYSNLCKIKSKNVSKSGNSATATIVTSSYLPEGNFVANHSLTVTLSCDKNGNLY